MQKQEYSVNWGNIIAFGMMITAIVVLIWITKPSEATDGPFCPTCGAAKEVSDD